jgi:hypothetical protein
MTDIVPHADQAIDSLVARPVWEQRTGESNHEYAWFVKYAELGETREITRAARLCGVPVKMLRASASKHAWDDRCRAYDATVVAITSAIQPREDEALATQYAAGQIMLRLGLEAIKLKNPALLKVRDIQALLQAGSEMVRRGAGVADLKVQHDVVQRVTEDLELLLGPEA